MNVIVVLCIIFIGTGFSISFWRDIESFSDQILFFYKCQQHDLFLEYLVSFGIALFLDDTSFYQQLAFHKNMQRHCDVDNKNRKGDYWGKLFFAKIQEKQWSLTVVLYRKKVKLGQRTVRLHYDDKKNTLAVIRDHKKRGGNLFS